MDGLLIDNHESWQELGKSFYTKRNLDKTPEVTANLMGRKVEAGTAWLKEHFNLSESVEELLAERNALTEKIYTELSPPMPGVDDLFAALASRKIKIAIASGASVHRIETIIDRYSWRQYLTAYVSAEETTGEGKPDPAVYIEAAKRLEVDPKHCLVFEDAPNGVQAGHAAGAHVVAIPSPGVETHEEILKADLVVTSLEDNKVLAYIDELRA